MKLNTNTWHYKVYDFTYDNMLNRENPPAQTNLCQYVQRIIWGSLWWGPLHVLAAASIIAMVIGVTICYYVVGTPIALILGWRPRGINTLSSYGPDYIPY